ncbi:hypothetical protein D3C85_816620 [compost metagenome]
MDGDEHYDLTFSGQCAHEVQHLHLPVHIEGAGRLVHEQDFRFAYQRLCNRHQLLLATAEFAEITKGQLGDSQCAEDLVHQIQFIVMDNPTRRQLFARQQHRFIDRQPGAGIQALGHVADPLRAFFRVLQVNLSRPIDQAGHAFEHGGLARRVGSDHGDHLAADERRCGHA